MTLFSSGLLFVLTSTKSSAGHEQQINRLEGGVSLKVLSR